MADIIKCKDCKYLQMWRTPEVAERFGQLYDCGLEVLSCPSPDDYCSKAKRKEEQKPGHWLMTGEVDVYYDLPSYECSKCGRPSLENGDYCPNCGCRMVEPQESEDKE